MPETQAEDADAVLWERALQRMLPPPSTVQRMLTEERELCFRAPCAGEIKRRRQALGKRQLTEVGVEDLVLLPFDEWRRRRVGRSLLLLLFSRLLQEIPTAYDICVSFGPRPTLEKPKHARASMAAWCAHMRRRPHAGRHVLLLSIATRFRRFSCQNDDDDWDGWDGHQFALLLEPGPDGAYSFAVIDTCRRSCYLWPIVDWLADGLRRRGLRLSDVRHVPNRLGVHGAPDNCLVCSLRAAMCLMLPLRKPLRLIRRAEPLAQTDHFHGYIDLQLLRMRRALLTDRGIWHPSTPNAVVLAHTVLGLGTLPRRAKLWLVPSFWFRKLASTPPLTMRRMAHGGTRHWRAVAFAAADNDDEPVLLKKLSG